MLESDIASLLPLSNLWAETTGSPEVLIAVLDGPADLSHPCFAGASLRSLGSEDASAGGGTAAQHGTHVASVIFAQHTQSAEAVQGIAPRCAGLLVPIFANKEDGSIVPCSEIRLASALLDVLREAERLFPGKDTLPLIINISGGQFSRSGQGHPLLVDAVKKCAAKNALIVAAAGNEGCDCLHVPGSLPSVLAVGAMGADGAPLPMSNWGSAYQTQGVLAPGQSIRGAQPGGGFAASSGTSFAAPVVSGVAALLLSLQLKLGQQPDPQLVRKAILASVLPCDQSKTSDCRLYLAGVLNIEGAMSIISKGERSMDEQTEAQEVPSDDPEDVLDDESVEPEELGMSSAAAETAINNKEPEGVNMAQEPAKSKCGCGRTKDELELAASASIKPSAGCPSCPGGAQLVYALGELSTDYGSEARQDSFTQDMLEGVSLLDYLKENPWAAQNLIWTLKLDATPIYAVVPQGPFASVIYERLRDFWADKQVERVAIPGYIGGTIKLMSGQTVPVIVPEIRGMYSWNPSALADAAIKKMSDMTEEKTEMAKIQLKEYLNRVYYDYRNLGLTPQERALNFSATNAFQVASIMKETVMETKKDERRVLDSISVEKSPLCRPDSDCYDVKLTFFDPDNNTRSRRVHRFTVDVSEVLPVTIGDVRSWAQS